MKLEGRNVRVGVSLGATVTVAPYQTVKPGVMLEVDVLELEDPLEVLNELERLALNKMEEQVDKICQSLQIS